MDHLLPGRWGGVGADEHQQDDVQQHGEAGGGGGVPRHLVGGEGAVSGSHLPQSH